MAKDEQSNQLNLTVVALVALVAIVGLVALVMNAASIGNLPAGSKIVSAEPAPAVVGSAYYWNGSNSTNTTTRYSRVRPGLVYYS